MTWLLEVTRRLRATFKTVSGRVEKPMMGEGVRGQIATVVVLGAVAGLVVVGVRIAEQPSPCCRGGDPYISLYRGRISAVDAVLAEGDGQAFGAIAQDPLLQRPAVIGSRSEYAYRAQRPLWAYGAWALSGGQPGLVGWALALLTVVSCGAATGVVALLLRERGAPVWWALAVPLVGVQALQGLTPELAALALLGGGILLWERHRPAAAAAALCLAALTRESMLVGVAALVVWELAHRGDQGGRAGRRRLLPLGAPFAVYATWVAILRIQIGALPFGVANSRLTFPGVGLTHAMATVSDPLSLGVRAVAIVALCAAALLVARDDVLTGIAVAFLGFASLLGPAVWGTQASDVRTLLPLYLFTIAAVAGGLHTRRCLTQGHTSEHPTTRLVSSGAHRSETATTVGPRAPCR